MMYKDGYKIQVVEDVYFETPLRPEDDVETDWVALNKDGRMAVKKGFACDFASGPTIDDDTNRTPSVFHDAAYQLMRLGLLHHSWWEVADRHMGDMCVERGMGAIRRWYYIRGLRVAGGVAARPENIKKAKYAP